MICRKCHADVPEAPFCCQCGAKQELAHKTKVRGNGTGSVYQLPNKKWRAIKTTYYVDANGKKHRRTISDSTFKSKKDAVTALANLGEERKQKTKGVTFSKVYELWLPTHNASRDTINCYKAAYTHFKALYALPIDDITVDDIQGCIDGCSKGKRTKQNMKTLCGLLYQYAIPRKMAEMNMCQYVHIRETDSESKEGLPQEAVEKIRAAVGDVIGADYVLCQCYLGFRPAEFLALKVEDYDREERAFIGGAKTEAGKNRVVTVSPKIQPIVDRLTDKDFGPVFCRPDGKKYRPEDYRDLFYSVLDSCGIENPVTHTSEGDRHKYTPHSCRHTFATMMKRVKAASGDKMKLIGHSSEEMLRYYEDSSLEDLRKITDSI